VVASKIGAMAEVIEDGRTGLHFSPGQWQELAERVQWAWVHPQEMEGMGLAARKVYETRYTAESNYKILMSIYQKVIDRRSL